MEATNTNGAAVLARILDHLTTGGVVIIATMTRATEYRAKHASLFKAAKDPEARGFYVQRGKHWDYVDPFACAVRFGRYVKGGK